MGPVMRALIKYLTSPDSGAIGGVLIALASIIIPAWTMKVFGAGDSFVYHFMWSALFFWIGWWCHFMFGES